MSRLNRRPFSFELGVAAKPLIRRAAAIIRVSELPSRCSVGGFQPSKQGPRTVEGKSAPGAIRSLTLTADAVLSCIPDVAPAACIVRSAATQGNISMSSGGSPANRLSWAALNAVSRSRVNSSVSNKAQLSRHRSTRDLTLFNCSRSVASRCASSK
jgi:hypothetical protein